MRATLLCAVLFIAAGCTSVPKPIPGSLCASVQTCDKAPVRARSAGLSPDRTVQFMLRSPLLIGGQAADTAEWPASVYVKAGSSACSATLVGERVLFMAAHCMDNNGTVSFTAHANAYKARCTHHPEYKSNDTADWALCLVDRPVTGVPFEMLATDARVALNATLLLSGYGCIKPGGGGGNDGIFRIGNATVRGLPGGRSYDIVTKGGAALCFGDSGGSAYLVSAKARYIVGVNSRGDIASMSYLPAVYSTTFVNWAIQWGLTYNNVRLCGVHSDALGCRSGQPAPQPDGKFEVSTRVGCVRGALAPEYLDKKEEIVENLRKSLEQF